VWRADSGPVRPGLAFDAPTLDDLEARKQCWREHGINVVGLDFGHSRSIYAIDPNGIMVEFSCTIREFTTPEERAQAERDLVAERPELKTRPEPVFFPPVAAATT
jgi:hypothetical protein